MTDLTNNAPITISRLSLPRLNFPKLGISAAITAVSASICGAYSMAYVEPFNALWRQPLAPDDFDLEGRDPRW